MIRLVTHPGAIFKKFYLEPNSLDEFSILSGISIGVLTDFVNEKILLNNEDITKLAKVIETTEEMWHRGNALYTTSIEEF